MDEMFQLPVTYNAKELSFQTKMVRTGFGVKFEVDINGLPVWFEPDEEQCYRALIDSSLAKDNKLDLNLLKEIASTLEFLMH